MSARNLSLSLILSLSLPLAAQSKDVEARKQAMVKEIQTVGSRQKLTTQGLVNVFAIAKKHGFVEAGAGETRWTGEGGGQLGTIITPASEAMGVSIERNHYWTTQISKIFCDASIVNKLEKYKIQKEFENSCFELGTTSSQNTAQLFPGEQNADIFLRKEELATPLMSNYTANLFVGKDNQLKFKLVLGGDYYQKAYVWPVNEVRAYRDEAKSKKLSELYDRKQEAQDKNDQKAVALIEAQEDLLTNGKAILDIKDQSNVNRAQAIKDLKISGLYNLPLTAKNAQKAMALAIAFGSKKTNDIVVEMLKVMAERIQKEKAIEKLITEANLNPGEQEKQAKADCSADHKKNVYPSEACKHYRQLADARLQQINKLSGIDKLREEKSDDWTKLHALDLKGLANVDKDPSYLRVMLQLEKEEK